MLKVKGSVKIVVPNGKFNSATMSLVELSNAFNRHGVPCTFYSQNEWAKKKTKFVPLSKLTINPMDRVIQHMMEVSERPICKKLILSCHERSAFPIKDRNITGYDIVRFESNNQMWWHRWAGPSVVIPNLLSGLTPGDRPTEKVAGVIGEVCERKQPHLAIQKALDDGYRVLIYGAYNQDDIEYIQHNVEPLLTRHDVQFKGLEENRQKIYESVSCVYSASKEESACRVQGECEKLGIPFYNIGNAPSYQIWNEEDIMKKWIEVLEL